MHTPILASALTPCPLCAQRDTQITPTDARVIFWTCPGRGETMRPQPGDCCVFCSYGGDMPCPPVQAAVTDCCS